MKFLSCFLALAIAARGLSEDHIVCYADNCARAVTGTRSGIVPDISSRRADCSRFIETVTAAPECVTHKLNQHPTFLMFLTIETSSPYTLVHALEALVTAVLAPAGELRRLLTLLLRRSQQRF